MELQFYGANCVRLTTKQATFIIDDNLSSLGLKGILKPTDVAICTTLPPADLPEAKLVISDPGEYEIATVSIRGIPARSHLDEGKQHSATIYKIDHDDIRLAILGHVYPDLSDDQLEAIGTVDVLIVPVGGNGYTLDPVGAMQLIKKIEPKVIIPTHFADSALKYEVPQQSLEDVLKAWSMEPTATVAKFKVKPLEFGEAAQVIVLERQ